MPGPDRNHRTEDVVAATDAAVEQALESGRREVGADYRAILDAAPAMIWVSGPDKKGIYFNQAWRAFTGRDLAEELGAGWIDAVHPDDADALAVCHHAFEHRRPFTTEFRLRRADGTYRWVLDRGVPRFDGTVFLGYVGCAIDIDERKDVESALADSDRQRDELFAVLVHELRRPLTAIRCALEVDLRLGSEDPRAVRARDVIVRQTDQLTRLVDDLLDVARIARGRLELDLERVDLGTLVEGLAADHHAVARAAGLDLSVRIAPVPLWARADGGRLAQAIGNLLDNAFKFTDAPGRIEIVVGRDPRSAMLLVSVRDTGAGIAPELLDRLFERGVPRRGTRSGLGLGLSIVRELAELHGGRVEAASDGPGHGATFTVLLPPAPGPRSS